MNFAKAQELSPFNTDRAVEIANMHLKWAAEELATASRLDPKNSELHFELGKFLVFQRDAARGVHELKEAALPATHPKYKEVLALMQFLAVKSQ